MNDLKDRTGRLMRSIPAEFKTREDSGALKIEGYFAVFDSIYEIAPGLSESIAPGAFDKTLSGDIRALINHDTTLVLGRTNAHGLWGSNDINPKDSDAMNLYNRVQRGDVDQCSFGFDIVSEETDFREDGSIHWTIKEVVLYEVSPCTFPAYEETNIAARQKQADEIKKRKADAWKETMLSKLKGESK